MPKTKRVAVVGGINLDIQARSLGAFRPGDSNPGSVSTSPGGVGRNIAENLVRLGLRVELVTALGGDPASEELERSCAALGIGLAGLVRLPDRAAPRYVCLLGREGELRGAVADMAALDELGPERLAERTALMDEAELVVVDANLPEASIAWLAERYGPGKGRDRRSKLVLDPVSAAKASRAGAYVGAFALAKPNLAEARMLIGDVDALILDASTAEREADSGAFRDVGRRAWNASTAEREVGSGAFRDVGRRAWNASTAEREADSGAFRDVRSRSSSTPIPGPVAEARALGAALRARGLEEVYISLGSEGILVDGAWGAAGTAPIRGLARPPSIPSPELATKNVSGAGDAACAALVWARLEGLGPEAMARLALAAAMLAAASESTVSAGMDARRLLDLAKGVRYEPLA